MLYHKIYKKQHRCIGYSTVQGSNTLYTSHKKMLQPPPLLCGVEVLRTDDAIFFVRSYNNQPLPPRATAPRTARNKRYCIQSRYSAVYHQLAVEHGGGGCSLPPAAAVRLIRLLFAYNVVMYQAAGLASAPDRRHRGAVYITVVVCTVM